MGAYAGAIAAILGFVLLMLAAANIPIFMTLAMAGVGLASRILEARDVR